MKLVLIEYGLQRFLIERAYCPLFDLSGCRGGKFVSHPLRQLLITIFKLPPQKSRLAYCETPLEFAAECLVVEQTLCNRHFLDLLKLVLTEYGRQGLLL